MTIDSETQRQLTNLANRRAYWLGLRVPDRVEAARYTERIDQLLDGRPGVYAVAADGEVLYDSASPWVLDQALASNETGVSERVTPSGRVDEIVHTDPDLIGHFLSGTAVLDRDDDRKRKLPKLTEADIEEAAKELGLGPSDGVE